MLRVVSALPKGALVRYPSRTPSDGSRLSAVVVGSNIEATSQEELMWVVPGEKSPGQNTNQNRDWVLFRSPIVSFNTLDVPMGFGSLLSSNSMEAARKLPETIRLAMRADFPAHLNPELIIILTDGILRLLTNSTYGKR
jgi:hypothetical protein